jgi:hypothetical protein
MTERMTILNGMLTGPIKREKIIVRSITNREGMKYIFFEIE